MSDWWTDGLEESGQGSSAAAVGGANETTKIPHPSCDTVVVGRDLTRAFEAVMGRVRGDAPWKRVTAPQPDLSWHKPTCTFEAWTHKEVTVKLGEGCVCITLKRPGDGNKFTGDITAGLVDALFLLHQRKDIRVVVFSGEGKMFCGGGDGEGGGGFNLNPSDAACKEALAGMQERAVNGGAFQSGNVNMARLLHAKLWHIWNALPQFSICLCNGSAMGDGMAMVAASDYVISVSSAFFMLSDIKMGLAPANLSPFLVSKIGLATAKKVFCTGENMSAETAKQSKVIDEVVPDLAAAQKRVKEMCEQLTKAGPRTVEATKAFISGCSGVAMSEALMFYTSEVFSNIKNGEEAKQASAAGGNVKPWESKPIVCAF